MTLNARTVMLPGTTVRIPAEALREFAAHISRGGVIELPPETRALPKTLHTATVLARVALALRSTGRSDTASDLVRLAMVAVGHNPDDLRADDPIYAQALSVTGRNLRLKL